MSRDAERAVAGTWAVVPAKDFARGKSRLSPALSDEARGAFAREVFDHVLRVVTSSRAVSGILVLTDAPVVAEAARAHGAIVRSDPPSAASLADVVDAGLADLAARGAAAGLVLMADLPMLLPDDVRALVDPLGAHDVVLARACDGHHTNALALRPATVLATSFGHPRSFDAHVVAARAARLRIALVDNDRVAFDVDGPDDHARLVRAR